MSFVHVPLFSEDPFGSVLDDLLDFTFPPMRYQPVRHGPRYLPQAGFSRPYPYMHNGRQHALEPRQRPRGTDDKFSVSLDVRHYTPEEINLKIEDGVLHVQGKHYREGQNGFESSEFKRSYSLPDDVDQSSLTSKINQDGILQVEAARKPALERLQSLSGGGLTASDDEYTVTLPTGDYTPEQITIKVNGRRLIIDGKQEVKGSGEHGDHVHYSEFHRSFVLPKDANVDAIQSKIQGDGNLVIRMPRSAALLPKEKVIPISFEGEGKDEEDQESTMEQ